MSGALVVASGRASSTPHDTVLRCVLCFTLCKSLLHKQKAATIRIIRQSPEQQVADAASMPISAPLLPEVPRMLA
jgi:hypothetical protein